MFKPLEDTPDLFQKKRLVRSKEVFPDRELSADFRFFLNFPGEKSGGFEMEGLRWQADSAFQGVLKKEAR